MATLAGYATLPQSLWITHLDTLLSGVHVNAIHGILDVLGLHLHAAVACALRGRLGRYRGAAAAAESLAITIDFGLLAIAELCSITIDLGLLVVACLLDLRKGHIIVFRTAGIVARVLHVGPHLGYIGMIHYTPPGASLYVPAGEVAALQRLVEAIVRGAIVQAGPIAGIPLGTQMQFGAIVDALHPVGILEYTYGQAAAIEAGLELVVSLWTRIRSCGLNEAGLNLWTAVAFTIAWTWAAHFARIGNFACRGRMNKLGLRSLFLSLSILTWPTWSTRSTRPTWRTWPTWSTWPTGCTWSTCWPYHVIGYLNVAVNLSLLPLLSLLLLAHLDWICLYGRVRVLNNFEYCSI